MPLLWPSDCTCDNWRVTVSFVCFADEGADGTYNEAFPPSYDRDMPQHSGQQHRHGTRLSHAMTLQEKMLPC